MKQQAKKMKKAAERGAKKARAASYRAAGHVDDLVAHWRSRGAARLDPGVGFDTVPAVAADEVLEGIHPDTAVSPPRPEWPTASDTTVERAYAFVDLCGFTAYTTSHGPAEAFEVLRKFRSLVRVVTSVRGVRIASFLGDGAFLVAVGPGPVIAAVTEIVARSDAPVRAAVSAGPALLFEGDDHIGEPVNRASRLCDIADAGEVLVTRDIVEFVPEWIEIGPPRRFRLKGLGTVTGVRTLTLPDGEADKLRSYAPRGEGLSM